MVKNSCPICHNYQSDYFGSHIRNEHGDKAFEEAVLKAKEAGMQDSHIGRVFGITFKQLEKIINRGLWGKYFCSQKT
jgi:hypothetical protein